MTFYRIKCYTYKIILVLCILYCRDHAKTVSCWDWGNLTIIIKVWFHVKRMNSIKSYTINGTIELVRVQWDYACFPNDDYNKLLCNSTLKFFSERKMQTT